MYLQIFMKLSKEELPFASASSNTEIPKESQTYYSPKMSRVMFFSEKGEEIPLQINVCYTVEGVKKGIYLYLQAASQ